MREPWTPCPFICVLALLAGACTSPSPERSSERPTASRPPNIIVILVDDLRWDELGVTGHPFVETPNIDRLAGEGALFTNAFHAVSLCSPNRASILTGQYPSRHGIIDNVARNRASHRLATFPQGLQQRGYETAYVGKWHMGNDPTPRPGFDYWAVLPGQGRTIDPELYEDGRIHTVSGYVTDILTDRVVAFIERDRPGPFFLFLGHKAVHPDARQLDDGSVDPNFPPQFIPAPRHLGRYDTAVFPQRPNVISSLDELRDKPALHRALLAKSPDEPEESTETAVRRRAEMLLAVDESVGRIVDALAERGILDDTFILFTSDNGYFYGEHGLTIERRMPYEESIRSPLIVRYPPLARPRSQIDALVVSIDIAPTILDVAGAPVSDQIQGRSLVPLFHAPVADWRESFLVEFYTYENPFPWLVDMDYRAIRTDRYKYIHWMQHPDENELYDLVDDPLEMENRIGDPRLAGVRAWLRGELADAAVGALGLRDIAPP